ncbi:MAG: hypothetical protein FWD25_01240 [Clostridia bacterium]|nr:hypothetical protein [Clostridia bacterium]
MIHMENIESIETGKLMNQLIAEPERMQREIFSESSSFFPSLPAYLVSLLWKRQCTMRQVITRSCLSKSYVYQVFSGDRLPGRDVMLRIAFALSLTLGETQRLLAIGNRPVLYPKVSRDAALISCICLKRSLEDASEFLVSIGERPLL